MRGWGMSHTPLQPSDSNLVATTLHPLQEGKLQYQDPRLGWRHMDTVDPAGIYDSCPRANRGSSTALTDYWLIMCVTKHCHTIPSWERR